MVLNCLITSAHDNCAAGFRTAVTKILLWKGIFNDLLLLQDFNFSEVECWCISFDEADISGYFDSFSVDSCLSLPKSAAV